MRRHIIATLAAVAIVGIAAGAEAQVSQSVSFNAGYFSIRGEDARPVEDVLVQNAGFLDFNISDFSGGTVGADWLVAFGDYLQAGVGIGYYRRTVPSVYRAYINDDGSEIAQDLRLRVAPLTLTARFLPLGRHAGFEPYVGAGLAVYNWRYSETGEFVDFTDSSIFRASYSDSGNEVGPVFLLGARVPTGDAFAVGGEFRYQTAKATLDPAMEFAGTKIDLGGYVTQVTFQLRF